MKIIKTFNSFKSYSTKTASDLRSIMRKSSHLVTIITTNHQEEFHGTTISSLTSISLDPIPLISFSIRLPSKLFNNLINSNSNPNQSFNVHLLNFKNDSILISNLFSKPRSNLNQIEIFKKLNQDHHQIGFGKLICSIWKTIDLIDDETKEKEVKSILILAKVNKVIESENHQSTHKPLLYYNQSYTTIKD